MASKTIRLGNDGHSSSIFRHEVEVIEADGLPMSSRGGKPDPLVCVSFKEPEISRRTRTLSATQQPLWSQSFVLETRQAMCSVEFRLVDREDVPANFLGSCTLVIGGPSRSVGARWLELENAPVKCRLRVVWQCREIAEPTVLREETRQKLEAEEKGRYSAPPKRPAEDVTPLPSVPAPPSPNGEAPKPVITQQKTEEKHEERPVQPTATPEVDRSAAPARHDTGFTDSILQEQHAIRRALADVVANVKQLSDRLDRVVISTNARFSELERRMQDAESALQVRRSLQRQLGDTSAADSAPRPPCSLEPEVDVMRAPGIEKKKLEQSNVEGASMGAQPLPAAPPPTAQATAEAPAASAIDSIATDPTTCTATDEKLLATYFYKPVTLPELRSSATYTHTASRSADSVGSLGVLDSDVVQNSQVAVSSHDRKLEHAVMALNHSAKDMIAKHEV